VSGRIAEIDWQSTPFGEISLRRRHDPVLDQEVFEVLLGDECLMSSSFTAAEEELAATALDSVSGNELRVLVGGLGPCAESSWDAVIVDIDHSPRHTLAPGNEWLDTDAGTRALAALLDDEGVFALWSNDPPDEEYLQVLRGTFPRVSSHVVSFPNPLQGGEATNTVYVAQMGER